MTQTGTFVRKKIYHNFIFTSKQFFVSKRLCANRKQSLQEMTTETGVFIKQYNTEQLISPLTCRQ